MKKFIDSSENRLDISDFKTVYPANSIEKKLPGINKVLKEVKFYNQVFNYSIPETGFNYSFFFVDVTLINREKYRFHVKSSMKLTRLKLLQIFISAAHKTIRYGSYSMIVNFLLNPPPVNKKRPVKKKPKKLMYV